MEYTSSRTLHSNSVLPSQSLKIYYGAGELEKLKTFKRVVIQPAYYCDSEIRELISCGITPIAYISLGEDPKEFVDLNQPYRRKRMNTDWNTHYVYVNSKEWQHKIQGKVLDYINRGFQGFLLDSLDVIDLFPNDREGMLKLVKFIHKELQAKAYDSYVIANRGFALMPELTSLIDATVFEGFTTRWTQDGKNEVMSTPDLHWSASKARELAKQNIDRYSLDYCHSDNKLQLEQFAIDRANYYGLIPLISNRSLTEI